MELGHGERLDATRELTEIRGHVGAVYYTGQSAGDWLAEADTALRSAQKRGANGWVLGEPAPGLTLDEAV